MMEWDVTALGELLVDFTGKGRSENGNPLWEANPGGAPCNVLAMLAKLGKKTAFLGKVGEDFFGRELAAAIRACGIDDGGLCMDKTAPTTLAFVHTLAGGEREFHFIRNPGADMCLTRGEVDVERIRAARVFHFGTLSSTHPGVREATRFAIDTALDAGAALSFDPNLRPPLWESMEAAKTEMLYGLSKCQILKISDNEVEFLLGHDDCAGGLSSYFTWAGKTLLSQFENLRLVFITCGADGSFAITRQAAAFAPVYPVTPVEKTGAGDTFFGCALSRVLDMAGTTPLTAALACLTDSQLQQILRFANAGAALITTRHGALRVMPDAAEIQALMG